MIAFMAGADASAGIVLTNGNYYTSGSGVQTTTVRVSSDGYVYSGSGGSYTQQYQWKQNSNASSSYDIYASVAGAISGTAGSWLSLGTTRDWSITDSTADFSEEVGTVDLQIRNASTLAVIATASFDLVADRL